MTESLLESTSIENDAYDLIVIGAGAAGMTAALTAHYQGLKVLLLEKTAMVGGTTSTSAGTIWIPGNQQSIDQGYQDSALLAKRYMDTLIGDDDPTGIRRAYLETAPLAIDYLQKYSEVKFVPAGKHPDYRDMEGAAIAGRALAPLTFDARVLGADFERVRPPIPEFMVLGGMMVGKVDLAPLIGRFKSLNHFVYAARLFGRYLMDRLKFSRGTRLTMGNALVARLFYSLKKNRVPVWFEAVTKGLIIENQSICGVRVLFSGKEHHLKASKGVVLATGGYGHHTAFRELCMPKPTPKYSMVCESVTGDGLELGLTAGANIQSDQQKPGGFWTPVSVTYRKDGSTGLYPHLSLDRAKPGLIAVNQKGVRFVNEGSSYHDFVEAMFKYEEGIQSIPAYLICESSFIQKYGLGDIHPGTKNLQSYINSGYIYLENTLDDLAHKLNINAAQLNKTVERHNQFAITGIDLDFGKGDTELNRFNGDPNHVPNPCLKEIKTGPFVAIRIWPAEIGTSAGLEANQDGQVLDHSGKAIKGLYVCGNDMASMMMGTYPGPGTTLGPALTFGYRVAMHASQRHS